MAVSQTFKCDTCWKFKIEKYTKEEFEQILANRTVQYVTMAVEEREDTDGFDLYGYMETLYCVDDLMIKNELDGFGRAEVDISYDDPSMYREELQKRRFWTERGIRTDLIAHMANTVGVACTDEEALKKYGSAFYQAWKVENQHQKARRQVIRDATQNLKDWQTEILHELENQDSTKILFVTAAEGEGKSALARYIRVKMDGFVSTSGDPRQIRRYYKREPYVILDSPLDIPYDLLVDLKNGKLFTGHRTLHIKPPKILVMGRAFGRPTTLDAMRARRKTTRVVLNGKVMK